MEINKELGTISEKELEEIASKAADAAGGEIVSVVTVIVTAVSWALCPTGACTNTGHCGRCSNLSNYNSSKF